MPTLFPMPTDPERQRLLEEDGYFIIRGLLCREEIDGLLELFNSHYNPVGHTHHLWNSLCDIPHDESAVLSGSILDIVKPRLERHFKDFRCPAATFLVKNAVEESEVPLHRDFSVMDESAFSYLNIWIPLIDTDSQTGQLYVLPGSHRFFDYPLPHNSVWSYQQYQDLMLPHCHMIDAKAGDMVVYSDKVPHGSTGNRTGSARPVVHFGLLHPDAKLLYHYLDEQTGEVTVYEVPYPFFFENTWGNQDGRFPIHGKYRFDPPEFSEDEILDWLRVGAVSSPTQV